MADYRDHYSEIKTAGAGVVAVSVDRPQISEALRQQLSLPFPILCDTERRVVREWDIYNSSERGGIAKPAVFVIDPKMIVRFASVDSVATRIPAGAVVRFLQNADHEIVLKRRVHVPGLSAWVRAIRNNLAK